ncbi:MAG: hypothetical protein V1861_01475 [Candidatus Micrarchaeota archaeon]
MPDDERMRLNILAKLSNLSVKFDKMKKKAAERNRWLEVKKELESMCGVEKDSDVELMVRLMESKLAREDGKPDPLSSEMALIRRKRPDR